MLRINFLITDDCNKSCSFCFHPIKNKNNILTAKEFSRHLDKIEEIFEKPFSIGLLGGDPLLNTDLGGMIKLLLSKKIPLCLHTNLLGLNLTNYPILAEALSSDLMMLSWNVTEEPRYPWHPIDIGLVDKLFSINRNKISQSITIKPDYDDVGAYRFAVDIYKKHGIYLTRLALDTTRHREFIHNDKAYKVFSYLLDNGLAVSPDICGYLLRCCLTKDQYKELNNRMIYKFQYGCIVDRGIPLDILPDGTAIPCLRFLKYKDPSCNIYEVDSVRELINRTIVSYKLDTRALIDKERDLKCAECKHTLKCRGPCPAQLSQDLNE